MQASLFDLPEVTAPTPPPAPAAAPTPPAPSSPHAPIFTPGCRLRIYSPRDRELCEGTSRGPAIGQEKTAVSVDYSQGGQLCRSTFFVGEYCIADVLVAGEWRDFGKHFGDIVPRAFPGKG